MVKPLSEREYQSLVASNDRVEGKLDLLTETIKNSLVKQAEINVRYDLSIEENSQQNINLSERQTDIEQTIIKNMPVIAFAAKLQSNMSKITIGIIVAMLGSYGININNAPTAAPIAKEASK